MINEDGKRYIDEQEMMDRKERAEWNKIAHLFTGEVPLVEEPKVTGWSKYDDIRRAFNRDALLKQGRTRTSTPLGQYYMTPEEAQEVMPVAYIDTMDRGVRVDEDGNIDDSWKEYRPCTICSEPFKPSRPNHYVCSDVCRKKRRANNALEYYHEKGKDARQERREKASVRNYDNVTALDRANLLDTLIRVTIVEMLQMYRTEKRWKKMFACLFLEAYGKAYMEAIGERVDFDTVLNTIDKEVGEDYGF
jgi:hypothetical protein